MSTINIIAPEIRVIQPKEFVEKLSQGHTYTNLGVVQNPNGPGHVLKYEDTTLNLSQIIKRFITRLWNSLFNNPMDDVSLVNHTIIYIDISSMKNALGRNVFNRMDYVDVLACTPPAILVKYVNDCQKKLNQQRDVFEKIIEPSDPFVQTVKGCKTISRMNSGTSGVYKVKNAISGEQFVVKPGDENQFALHNGESVASVLHIMSTNDDVPTQQQVLNGALAYDVAKIVGIEDITPKTGLVVLESEKFNTNFSFKSNKKLASAQKFVKGAEELEEYKKTDKNLDKINPEDFQNVNLLIWITGALDANKTNILVHSDGENSKQRLKLIDNDISFGEGIAKTSPIVNGLSTFKTQMKKPLSAKSKEIIKNINIEEITKKMKFYGKSQNSIIALATRVNKLKYLAEKSGITLETIDNEMKDLSKNDSSTRITPIEELIYRKG